MEDLLEFALVAVPLGAIATIGYLSVRNKIRSLRLALAREAGANKTSQIAMEKSVLEERVRVLERIVTDKGYGLAEEIEALRDTSQVEDQGSGVPFNVASKETA